MYTIELCKCIVISQGYRVSVPVTCENVVYPVCHQVCILHTEAHGRFKLDNVLPGAVCTDTDILLFQSGKGDETNGYFCLKVLF